MAAAPPTIGSPAPRKRRWRVVAGGALVLAALAVAARLALPGYLVHYVNGVLERSPEYDGRVSEIDVHLWRGAYTIHDLKIVKISHAVPVPFFEAPRVDLSLDWSALLHGQARGKLVLERPKLRFVHGPSPDETQTGADQPWLAIIHDMFPFRIDKAEVIDGEIHFHAFHVRPQVHARLTEVRGEVTNLTNASESTEPLIAAVHATGLAMESGRLQFDMTLDPESHRPSFEMAVRLLDLDARRLNDLALAYGGFDFEQGRFDLVVEMSAKEGFIQGYTKPLFRGARVLSARDVERDPLRAVWQGVVGAVGTVFKNQAKDQFGTRIAFEGDLDNPRSNLLETIGNVLRNAFVRAYLPRYEGRLAPEVAAAQDSGFQEGSLLERFDHENDRRSSPPDRAGPGRAERVHGER